MKLKLLTFLLCFSGLFFILKFSTYQDTNSLPLPTEGKTIVNNNQSEEGSSDREEWIEAMHRANPDVDWKEIEYQTQMTRHQSRTTSLRFRSDCGVETVIEDQLKGKWNERGSSNQAGSVFDTEFDPETNLIWLVSAGGTIWRGDLDGTSWEVVNQDFQFNPGLLRFIPQGEHRRLLAVTGRIPHYSDDDGQTWNAASGITYTDPSGNFNDALVLEDTANTVYILSNPFYWDPITLYKSSDKGVSYQPVETFSTNFFSELVITKPDNATVAYLANKQGELFELNPATEDLVLLNEGSSFNFGSEEANLVCYQDEFITRFYAYSDLDGSLRLYTSDDFGMTWLPKGEMPTEPWNVGVHVSPYDPDVLFYGEVNCYKSLDGGSSWTLVNQWWEYYDNITYKLHADIMYFGSFKNQDGEPFHLISHHGGLTKTYDNLTTQENISLEGLNVSQYYSVKTNLEQLNYVYAGSQDQGFQLSDVFFTQGVMPFDQVISGDYGHIVFSNNGNSLWTVYPGGWVTYYEDALSGALTESYDLVSENESVWLPPLFGAADGVENAIYMAGGSIDGGPGSYLIRLEADEDGNIEATQGDFDFYAASAEGTITAIEISGINPDKRYVATSNGRFFYSDDGGENWEQSLNFLPDGHYLYGQSVLASKVDSQTVYLAGSGYSNPAVYKSTNGGHVFVPMVDGLPPTLVFDLAADIDERFIYAATEAGPYVFSVEDEYWYDLSGSCAPAQTYWCVEYLDGASIARFGTYGRGIWDFDIDEEVQTEEVGLVADQVKVFPNPLISSSAINIEVPPGLVKGEVHLFNNVGQRITQFEITQIQDQYNLPALTAGIYLLYFTQDQLPLFSKKVVVQ